MAVSASPASQFTEPHRACPQEAAPEAACPSRARASITPSQTGCLEAWAQVAAPVTPAKAQLGEAGAGWATVPA